VTGKAKKGDDRVRGRWTFGLCVMAIGVLILLRNLHVVNISLGWVITHLWPLLLIIWGLNDIIENNHAQAKICGVIVTAIGLIFLGRNLGWFFFDWHMLWKLIVPGILILLGIAILTKSFYGGKSHFALMSGIEMKDSWRVDKGTYWAFMGGIEQDLRMAEIPDGVTDLQYIAFMGGINVIVPPGLAVVCDGTSILGGVGFFGKENGGILANLHAEQGDIKNSPKILRIHSLTFMGGIEVKAVDN
jgi:predicted membrane protein